ncbi:MAG: hypothetical protein WD969_07370 [Paracoccaceae bacterium]
MPAFLMRGGASAAAVLSASVMFGVSAEAAPIVDLGRALAEADRPAAISPATHSKAIKSFKSKTLAVIADISADAGPPERDPLSTETEFDAGVFKSDPIYEQGYDPDAQIEIYGGKKAVKRVSPLVEIGRDLYGPGEIGEGVNVIGEKNRLTPQLLVFGDARTAVAYNKDAGGKEVGQVATRLNLFANLQLTGTERILMLWEPLQDGAQFSRYEFTGPDRNRTSDPQFETQGQPTTLFFEGDLGAIAAGLSDEYNSYDIPISVGRMPLLFQNGVWMEDAFLGAAITLPAQNSAALGITNYDLTLFGGGAEITSDGIKNGVGRNDDKEAAVIGLAGFFDVAEGYLETGAAYIIDKDHSDGDFSYLNLTAAFSKRYFGKVSNATRVIVNVGQSPGGGRAKAANGVLLISENAFITSQELTLVPYANFWLGKDNPQSVARAAAAGGILRNVGLAFESDNLTGFPTLDPTGRDTAGGAIGVQYLFALDQQLVAEVAAVIPWDGRNGAVADNQYAASLRYQIPITNQVILRADAIYGVQEGPADDLYGARFEVRVKF